MKTLFVKTFETPAPGCSYNKLTTHNEIVEHNGRKFRIYIYVDTSSDCVGFNRNCCLSVMTNDGTFAQVVDNRELDIKLDRHSPSTSIPKVVKEFKDFIKKVY